MSVVIKLKYSDTATVAPAALTAGELAINRADKKLYYTDSANAVQSMSLAGTSPDARLITGTVTADVVNPYPQCFIHTR